MKRRTGKRCNLKDIKKYPHHTVIVSFSTWSEGEAYYEFIRTELRRGNWTADYFPRVIEDSSCRSMYFFVDPTDAMLFKMRFAG